MEGVLATFAQFDNDLHDGQEPDRRSGAGEV
jgi:hypothetical protein